MWRLHRWSPVQQRSHLLSHEHHRRHHAPPPTSSSAEPSPSASSVHLEDRITHLEEQFTGVSTWLDRSNRESCPMTRSDPNSSEVVDRVRHVAEVIFSPNFST
ncbi:unnamed protein product [Linum trigynum]|uniref:Uncharacterized protein n=1 Tax=Linum trigynum TaxID=586398 RepID=A0AAV2FRF3_9ROSI